MEQIKTGKFIAELRKEKGMTQEQLATDWASIPAVSPAGKMVTECRISHCCLLWQMCWV